MSTARIASPREELANALTHGAGLVASLIGMPVLVMAAANRGERAAVVGASVFGAALIALYAASTLYHACSTPSLKQKFRLLDHMAIYVLIAGTYTPFTLGVLRGRWGWTLFGIVWTMAALGMLFKALFGSGAWSRLSTAMYVTMGWMAIFVIKPLVASLESAGMLLLVGGGLLYTGGVAFYVQRRSWSHPVWHLFVMGGSACHYFAVLGYAFPQR